MPGFDGTGPRGGVAGTGRGLGPCGRGRGAGRGSRRMAGFSGPAAADTENSFLQQQMMALQEQVAAIREELAERAREQK